MSEHDDEFEDLRERLGDVPDRMQRAYHRWVFSRCALISLFLIGSALSVLGALQWWPLALAGSAIMLATAALTTAARQGVV
jgi:hypothetical protein